MPKEPELDLDELLAVLGNPLRREILARIARETHYPLQLSKELGVSQQAIMKHLAILRRYRLVRCTEKKSTSLGPPRKCYVSTGQFSIRIDFGPSAFETRLIPLLDRTEGAERGGSQPDSRRALDLETDFRSALELPQTGDRLRACKELVSRINDEVEALERKRMVLMAIKQEVLREAAADISRMSPDYQERRLLYILAENPETPMEEMARMLHIQREALVRIYRDFFGEDL